MLGWRFPIRPGTTPPLANAEDWLTRAANADDSRFTSMNWPRPLTPLSASAATMPTVAYRPVITSTTATPVLVGGPPDSPVMLMKPLAACTMKS